MLWELSLIIPFLGKHTHKRWFSMARFSHDNQSLLSLNSLRLYQSFLLLLLFICYFSFYYPIGIHLFIERRISTQNFIESNRFCSFLTKLEKLSRSSGSLWQWVRKGSSSPLCSLDSHSECKDSLSQKYKEK